MVVNKTGNVISKIVGVDNSIHHINHIAFQDIDGAVFHINVSDVEYLYNFFLNNNQKNSSFLT